MDISYNAERQIYSIDNTDFDQNQMVQWVQSGGLAQTLKNKNRVRLITETSVALSIPAEKCIQNNVQYLTALRTKPFVLLAGISGTGKSRIVRKLAQATNDIDKFADEASRWKCLRPANFEIIQVKPNWHNSMDVVGYLSNIPKPHYVFTPFVEFVVRAWMHPLTPFFLCLDEMNLAPVEEYFAEFLSAIESRDVSSGSYETDPIIQPFDSFGNDIAVAMVDELNKNLKVSINKDLENRLRTKGLTLPQNLMVMGTVNMDDTTHSFSRKVLDRAMSIEMNEVDLYGFLAGHTNNDMANITAKNYLLVNRPVEAQTVIGDVSAQKIIEYLVDINNLLESTPFKLGYRAANEAILYVAASIDYEQNDLTRALDEFTLMKILSRIEGDDSKLKTTVNNKELDILPALRDIVCKHIGEYYELDEHSEKQLLNTIKKIDQMSAQLKRDHFVTYWN